MESKLKQLVLDWTDDVSSIPGIMWTQEELYKGIEERLKDLIKSERQRIWEECKESKKTIFYIEGTKREEVDFVIFDDLQKILDIKNKNND